MEDHKVEQKKEYRRFAKFYSWDAARYWTVTDEGLSAAYNARRQAASDVNYWNELKPLLGRFAKEEMKAAQRMEKAATIWINHFTAIGKKSLAQTPVGLSEELNAVLGLMVRA